jgi:exo-beta-1,3-glucanase (GH17 family)
MTASETDIREDLRILYEAGFRGVVTYSAGGVLAEVPRLARETGFEGIVIGVWAPGDAEEIGAALQTDTYVDGYVVGNEGLYFNRYDLDTLERAVAELKERTGKPVTTTEVLSLYFKEPRLLELGDWTFPNTHPYWQGITDPFDAVTWTEDTFDELETRSNGKPVVLKEVGLPTEGAPRLSQNQQALYYTLLRESPVSFIYFEAFDQFWKSEDGVGPFWGLFDKDRSPKVASEYILSGYSPFYVYADAGLPDNHFAPEGWMGCWQGIEIDENDQSGPYEGMSAISIAYRPQAGCDQKWAGVYWWDPPGSEWCDDPGGFDLTGWTKLTFWAKGAKGGESVEFKVGGLTNTDGDDCDSLQPSRTTYPLILTNEWQQYSISLYEQDLSQITGGFVWVTDSQEAITFYLDEIRFEWGEGR